MADPFLPNGERRADPLRKRATSGASGLNQRALESRRRKGGGAAGAIQGDSSGFLAEKRPQHRGGGDALTASGNDRAASASERDKGLATLEGDEVWEDENNGRNDSKVRESENALIAQMRKGRVRNGMELARP